MSIATTRGTTEAERALPYPCDGFVERLAGPPASRGGGPAEAK